MLIRPALDTDVPAIQALIYDNEMEIDGIEYRNFSDPILVAEVDGRVVGFISALLGHPLSVLMEFAVAPEFQQRGVGRLLIQSMEGLMREKGIQAWVACVDVERDLAQFLERKWPVKFQGQFTGWVRRL